MDTSKHIRRIDDLGRVIIPKEIRRVLNIWDGDSFEITVIDDNILLRKVEVPNAD